jgi:hypothetical protein
MAIVAGLGLAIALYALATLRRPMPVPTRVFRKRLGVVGLFVAFAGGAGFALLASPVEPEPGAGSAATPLAADTGDEVASARRFSSDRLPALSLDAPPGWTLELDPKKRKLTAVGAGARLLISTARLKDAADVDSMLREMAESQRTLGFEVGPTFTDRIGNLPAGGFVATGPTRSVCTWMVRRDTHLASSLICTTDGKASAREACRAVLANLRWRAPASYGTGSTSVPRE